MVTPPVSRNTKPLVTAVIVVLLVIGYLWFTRTETQAPKASSSPAAPISNTPEATNTDNNSASSPEAEPAPEISQVKMFTLTGTSFAFSQTELRVQKGDRVKIVFTNNEGFHNWVLDEFNVSTPQLPAGQTAEVEFVADKTGVFEYYCSVGRHREMGMKGNLIVE